MIASMVLSLISTVGMKSLRSLREEMWMRMMIKPSLLISWPFSPLRMPYTKMLVHALSDRSRQLLDECRKSERITERTVWLLSAISNEMIQFWIENVKTPLTNNSNNPGEGFQLETLPEIHLSVFIILFLPEASKLQFTRLLHAHRHVSTR